jgi:hypothetical protein
MTRRWLPPVARTGFVASVTPFTLSGGLFVTAWVTQLLVRHWSAW